MPCTVPAIPTSWPLHTPKAMHDAPRSCAHLQEAVPSRVEGPLELQHVAVLLWVNELIGEVAARGEGKRVMHEIWWWGDGSVYIG